MQASNRKGLSPPKCTWAIYRSGRRREDCEDWGGLQHCSVPGKPCLWVRTACLCTNWLCYQNPMGIFVKIVLMICILFFTDQVWFRVHKSTAEPIPLAFSQFALGHSYGDICG